jgi:hypothetical protein
MESKGFLHLNSMIKHLLISIFFFSSLSLFAQDSVVVVVTVKSKMEQETIQNVQATIEIGSKSFYKKTNTKGVFTFGTIKGAAVSFKLSHTQFSSSNEFKRISTRHRGDTVNLQFDMESIRTQRLDEMVVTAPGVPDTVFVSDRIHVSDFEMQNNGDLLLLTYAKRLKKGSELVVYDGIGTIKSRFQVPGIAQELIRDYRGNPHVVCERNIYGIHAKDESIGISTVPKEYYMTYLAPIVDTNKTKLYFSNFNKDYPAFDYFSFDQLDSTYKQILSIEDELMMELYRSEYKWADVRTKLWALNKEIETGVDAEIWVGANYFTQSIYYKELYAPLFHRNDSLFVFDYYKDKLYTFDAKGNELDSVGIYHHYNPRSTGWQKQLVQDRETGQIYAVFDRAGYTYLGWVDTKTGEITEQVKLHYRYVDKVAVHGNFVYYIYREFESTDKKTLFRERLPYDFGKGTTPIGDDTKLVEH